MSEKSARDVLVEALYSDAELGPGYMLREDCEHLADRILSYALIRCEHGVPLLSAPGTTNYCAECYNAYQRGKVDGARQVLAEVSDQGVIALIHVENAVAHIEGGEGRG